MPSVGPDVPDVPDVPAFPGCSHIRLFICCAYICAFLTFFFCLSSKELDRSAFVLFEVFERAAYFFVL